MRSRPLVSLLLTGALLLGQWLAAAHETEHSALPDAAHICAICAYAHGAGAGALPAMPQLALAPATQAPEFTPAASPLAATLRHYPIRGPPQLL